MATILLTGATGTVGSGLALLLKKRGYKIVYLVRNKANLCGKGITLNGDVAWEGDVVQPDCGVTASQIEAFRGTIDMVVSCAASVKFDEQSAVITTRTNVDGCRNVLELARKLGINKIHHVSTAYVAGDAESFTEDDLDKGQTPRNVYESTKRTAEGMVRDWPHGKYSIHRLGIVVGDSATGHISSFNGYYGFLGSIWHLRQFLASMSVGDRAAYVSEGIEFDVDGLLNLPIYGGFSPTSTLNIVPLDWTFNIMAAIIGLPVENKVFHIVDPNPQRVRWINDVSLGILGVRNFLYERPKGIDARSRVGRLQKMFDRGTVQYGPYIRHETRFAVTNTEAALGGILPPLRTDEVFLARILGYAKAVNFGKEVRVYSD